MKVSMSEVIRQAVREKNPRKAGKVADVLRFRFGLDYESVYNVVNKIEPISKEDWEALMYEADTAGE